MGNQTWYWEKMWLFLIGNGAEIRPLEMGRKCPGWSPTNLCIPYIFSILAGSDKFE